MMSRDTHLQWAKNNAFEYCDRGELQDALISMISDLRKHPELEKHGGIELGVMMLAAGLLRTPAEMRKFIEGFN